LAYVDGGLGLLWGVFIYNKGVIVVVAGDCRQMIDRSGGKKAVPIAETTDVQNGKGKI